MSKKQDVDHDAELESAESSGFEHLEHEMQHFAKQLHFKQHAKLFLLSLFPPRVWLPQYNLNKLKSDVLAAVTVVVMLIPQAVAYASLAGLEPRFGIYSAAIPNIVYALLGTSRQLAIGPVALISMLTFESLTGLGLTPGSDDYHDAAILVAFVAGVTQLIMGIVRLGVLVSFLAHPVVAGFTTAAGFVIGSTQLGHLIGLEKVEKGVTIFHTVYNVLVQVPNANVPATIIGVVCLAVLLAYKFAKKRFKKQAPWLSSFPLALLLVVVFTAISFAAQLAAEHGTPIVGELAPTFPNPTSLNFNKFTDLIIPAILMAIVGFMESVSLASGFAADHNYRIEPSQELIALGAADLVGSFFSSMPITGSLGRSAVANNAGAQTQMFGFIVGLLVLAGGAAVPLLEHLPKSVLAAIILAACVSLWKFKELIHLWHTDKRDFFLMLATIILSLLLGVKLGLAISIALSLLNIVQRSSRAHWTVLGIVPESMDDAYPIFRSVKHYPHVLEVKHVVLMRYDASIVFSNSEHFVTVVHRAIQHHAGEVRAVVLDFSSVNACDSTGGQAIVKLIDKLKEQQNIQVLFAHVKHPVRHRFAKLGLMQDEDGDYDPATFPPDLRLALLQLHKAGVTDSLPWLHPELQLDIDIQLTQSHDEYSTTDEKYNSVSSDDSV